MSERLLSRLGPATGCFSDPARNWQAKWISRSGKSSILAWRRRIIGEGEVSKECSVFSYRPSASIQKILGSHEIKACLEGGLGANNRTESVKQGPDYGASYGHT